MDTLPANSRQPISQCKDHRTNTKRIESRIQIIIERHGVMMIVQYNVSYRTANGNNTSARKFRTLPDAIEWAKEHYSPLISISKSLYANETNMKNDFTITSSIIFAAWFHHKKDLDIIIES